MLMDRRALKGPLIYTLHPHEHITTVTNYSQDLPVRSKAVDLEISTTDTWNYAIVPDKAMTFDAAPSKGWTNAMPFDTENYPSSITVSAQQLPEWGYWDNSKITADVPPSPIDCTKSECGKEVTLKLVPFGGTYCMASCCMTRTM